MSELTDNKGTLFLDNIYIITREALVQAIDEPDGKVILSCSNSVYSISLNKLIDNCDGLYE